MTLDKRGFDELTEVKLPPREMTDYEYADQITRLMADSDVTWNIVREEAEEALRLNPHDEIAKAQMLRYENWKRQTSSQTLAPKVQKSGLTLVKTGRKMTLAKSGAWVRDARYGWVVRANGCDVGDVVTVRKKGGVIEQIKLTAHVIEGTKLFRGVKQ